MPAAIGGLGPGLLATFVGALLGMGIAMTPADEKLAIDTPAEQLRLRICLLGGVGISLIPEVMGRARGRAREETERLQRRNST